MTTAISDGRKPPFIVENFKYQKLSGGNTVSTHTQRWVVSPSKKEEFLKGLALHDEDGLSLVNVSPSLQGGLLYVSLEYSSDASAKEVGVTWYSSTRDGLVLHERRIISLGSTHSYALGALGHRAGLRPNGASITPSPDGLTATYEASWGPNEEPDNSGGDGGDGGAGGDGGDGGSGSDKDEDKDDTTTDIGISMSSAMGTVTLTGDAALKYRIGEANYNLLESDGGNWRVYMQAIISGTLIYGPRNPYSGESGQCWQWSSSSPFPNQVASDIPGDMVQILKMAATAQAAGAVSVPVQIYKAEVTSSMKVRAKSQSLALAAVMGKFSASGSAPASLPAPEVPFVGAGIALTAAWKQMGVSTNSGITSTKVYNRYGNSSGGAMYVTEYTINYTTSYETVVSVASEH